MTRLLWISGLLLAAAWLNPLHVLPWMSWHNEALGTLAVLAAGGGALWLQRRSPQPVLVPSVAVLPVLVAAGALLQWIAGRIAYAGSLWTIVSYAVLCAAAAALGHAALRARPADATAAAPPGRALEVLALLLVFTGFAQVLVDMGQTLWLWPGADWVSRISRETRGGGNVAQPNQAAQLFVLAMAATVYLWQSSRIRPVVAAATLALLALGLATTQSRSGMFGLVAVVAWYLWRREALPRRAAAWPALALLAFALLLFATWYPMVSAFWGHPPAAVSLTTSGRTEMWRQFLQAVALRPWAGWGVMQVAEAQNAIAHGYPLVMAATFAHNVVLDLALWLGVPGMLLALALAAKWLWPRLPQARTLDTCFCVALVLPFAVQSLTEFPYAYTYFLLPVFFALGAFDALAGRAAGLRVPRPAAIAFVAAWAGASLWAMAEYVVIEEDFRVARFEALRVGQTPAAYDVPEVHLLTQLGALLQATRIRPRSGMPPEELEVLRNVALLHPWGATSFRYATALALNGRMDEALRQLQVLRATHGPRAYAAVLTVLDEMAVDEPVLKQLRLP